MLRVIPQICLQCGETTGKKSVQAELQTPSTVNGYVIGFGKFTFTFCNIEHFMLWVTSLLTTQVERSKTSQDDMLKDSITQISSNLGEVWHMSQDDGDGEETD